MIKPDQIPKECFVAYQRAFKRGGGVGDAIAAALNAWPGMQHKPYWDFRTHEKHTELILPVPQKEKGGQ